MADHRIVIQKGGIHEILKITEDTIDVPPVHTFTGGFNDLWG